jgi:hypothetical protein
MALAASIPRSLWGVYLRASQAFPLALIRREQDNKTQNNTTTKQAVEKNQNNQKMDSPLELSMGFKFVDFFFPRKVDVTYAGSGK